MKLKRFFTHRADNPMGALNDLSFLLIIYFLVIAGFNTNTGFLLNLPSREKPRIVQREDLIRLSLRESGALFFRENPLESDDLETLIKESLKSHPNLTVSLSMHPDVPYQRFVDTLYVIRFHGVVNFSFSMDGSGGTL